MVKLAHGWVDQGTLPRVLKSSSKGTLGLLITVSDLPQELRKVTSQQKSVEVFLHIHDVDTLGMLVFPFPSGRDLA